MSSAATRVLTSVLLICILWNQFLVPHASAKILDPMQQGFLFDWAGDQSPPIPTAAQCDVLHITWGRRSATGPDPIAPYFLQVYTSGFIVPFVIPAGSVPPFDWPVPFVPGTEFQICMFASNGVTGGCQAVYSVYQPPGTTLDKPPICQNLTYPAGALDVTAKTQDGSWSQYGWINQCSDISLTPNNGTPPYTYTISPALRPPINITSETKDPVDWTVSLMYGLPFWVTVADSTGSTWTNGPLHAGDGSTACLINTSESTSGGQKQNGLVTGGAVGVALGTLILGIIVGTLASLFFLKHRERAFSSGGVPLLQKTSEHDLSPPLTGSSSWPQQPGTPGTPQYGIEPFVYTQDSFGSRSQATSSYSNTFLHEQQPSNGSNAAVPTTPSHNRTQSDTYPPSVANATMEATSPTSSTGQPFRSPGVGAGYQGQPGSQVYVVHHDGGRAPVTVFTAEGTQVVELPPDYSAAQSVQRPMPPPPEGRRRRPEVLSAKSRVLSNTGLP